MKNIVVPSKPFPDLYENYEGITPEEFVGRIHGKGSRNLMILGRTCCFSAIASIQKTFQGRDDLEKALIGQMRTTNENVTRWTQLFNENLISLGYDDLTELLLDCNWERVEEPQVLDICWNQTEPNFGADIVGQPFDKNNLNNGYIYDGEHWLERFPRSWKRIQDEDKVSRITSNGIFRLSSV